MLKLRELRVGNLLKDRENRICKVEKIDAKEHSFSAPAINGPWTSLPITPIPLNEGVLLAMGFKKEKGEWKLFPCFEIQIIVFNQGDYNGVMFYTRSAHTDYKPIHAPYEINNVHQIQNLYFALTGEELDCKIKE